MALVGRRPALQNPQDLYEECVMCASRGWGGMGLYVFMLVLDVAPGLPTGRVTCAFQYY